MEDETHGAEETAQQHPQGQEDEQAVEGAQEAVADGGEGFKALLAQQDERIKELEAQVADAAKTRESAERLTAEIEKVKAQAADERVGFELKLAGARNVKAARALLGDHGGDVAALKDAEPWLFSAAKSDNKGDGTTGLVPAGASTDRDKTLKRWRKIAGLDDDEQ